MTNTGKRSILFTAPECHPAGSRTWMHSVLQHKYFTAKSVCLAVFFFSTTGDTFVAPLYLKCAGTGITQLSKGFEQLTSTIYQYINFNISTLAAFKWFRRGLRWGEKSLQSNNGLLCPNRTIVFGRVLLGKLTWELLKLSPELCSSGRFSSHHPRIVNFPFWTQSGSEGQPLGNWIWVWRSSFCLGFSTGSQVWFLCFIFCSPSCLLASRSSSQGLVKPVTLTETCGSTVWLGCSQQRKISASTFFVTSV